MYGKGVLEGLEILTCVGKNYRKSLSFPVQLWHRPAEGFSSATWQMATGAHARHVYHIHYSWQDTHINLAVLLATLLHYESLDSAHNLSKHTLSSSF